MTWLLGLLPDPTVSDVPAGTRFGVSTLVLLWVLLVVGAVALAVLAGLWLGRRG